VGSGVATVAAAIVAFAVLPNLGTFAAFSLATGCWLVPTDATAHRWQRVAFTYMAAYFVPVLGPANLMTYDTVQFYNTALAILSGAGAAALSFRLLPPLSAAFRTRRLLALTLHDLRHLARERMPADWEGHVHGRLPVMREQASRRC
jgi:uncharacterized membrane protein YccC